MVADGTRLEFTAEIANVKTVAAKKSTGYGSDARGKLELTLVDGHGVGGGLTVRRFAGGHVEEAEALARGEAFMAPRLVLGREGQR